MKRPTTRQLDEALSCSQFNKYLQENKCICGSPLKHVVMTASYSYVTVRCAGCVESYVIKLNEKEIFYLRCINKI